MNQAKSGNYIKFLPEGRDVLVSHKDKTVLEVAIRAGIALNHTCGGMGTCGTCQVRVITGVEMLPTRDEIEQEMALDRNFTNVERLACQMPPLHGLELEVPKEKKD